MSEHKLFGEILVQKGKLKKDDLTKALKLQKDNPNRKLGEILVTLNCITHEDIADILRDQYASTGSAPAGLEEWLSQPEIDTIVRDMAREMNNK